ncbi:MAG: S-methyl-5-thioribose-1-phosphate isomerase [bacterium]|nr:S-methyl-5-thioribose-1-phosphate isomerase [bacterium]
MLVRVQTLYYKNHVLYVLDQLQLPHYKKYIACRDWQQVSQVIKKMNIRGAPAIGVAAAFGIALAAGKQNTRDKKLFISRIHKAANELAGARPTAVNLAWAIRQMLDYLEKIKSNDINKINTLLETKAQQILDEDVIINKKMAVQGEKLIPQNACILTHCNAGALATAGYGTALGVIREAHKRGKKITVWVDETRPYLQGARLTAWELKEENIPFRLISDNMAGHFISRGEVDCIITGADRVAANGDTANKIGTYTLAVLAKENHIPFYIAAPLSTIDLRKKTGQEIVIEERSADEVTMIAGKRIAPAGISVKNPAFDITPHKYITAIITEKGIIRKPYTANLKRVKKIS